MTGKEYCDKAERFNDGEAFNRLMDIMVNDGTQLHANISEAIHATLGLTGEAGEVADLIKKVIFHEKELDKEHLKKEIGDVMWYIHLLCHAFRFDLDEIMQMNIAKLDARYPNGFNTYDANHRKEGDI